ncbi:LLM class flavin-dependent oxidoreductase [Actinocorallia aurea]
MRLPATSAPAVPAAQILAATTTLTVGSGAVLLPNHAPYAVAEQFGALACPHPGRVDPGLSRATGGAPHAAPRRGDPRCSDFRTHARRRPRRPPAHRGRRRHRGGSRGARGSRAAVDAERSSASRGSLSGAGCGVRGAGCGVRGAGCGVRGAGARRTEGD